MNGFHPAVEAWFSESFPEPTRTQRDAWRAIASGGHTLVSAPTGSGKTLAAFMVAIDGLVRQAVEATLEQRVSVVYVSPLKSLSNDIHRNLEAPLGGIEARLGELKPPGSLLPTPIQTAVRTGDTTRQERARMAKNPPHILVTTPESLYILLTSRSGRRMLSGAETMIIDEIHTMVGTKRGAHLSLSVERLECLCEKPLVKIGLTATQRPIELAAGFLTGEREGARCEIIDSGHQRNRDIGICTPGSPLSAVMSAEAWEEICGMLEDLINEHATTLIFVNTRRLAERMAKALGERLGNDAVTSHHGSLAREHRFAAEQQLKAGALKAIVATASLELGIDIGDVDLVCQIGSPRAVSVLLQRVGRSGHGIGRTPKGRLFPLSRNDLVECAAVLECVERGELDRLSLFPKPLDVLAQQIVAEVSAAEWGLDDLFAAFRRAAPYATLERGEFDQVIAMLAEGFAGRRGRHSAYLHLDAVNGRIRPRKSAALTAVTNGGTIPDLFDYDVVLHPESLVIGSLNEDFSFEAMAGDIFLLGNTSYRIERVESGKVHVCDARGRPPTIPFWFGEAPGRTDMVSQSVARLRSRIETLLEEGIEAARRQIGEEYRLDGPVSAQLVGYLGAARASLGALPDDSTVIFERFFDEAGDQHLVVHSSFGVRINRAWGLALRKRFCRKFNFELQAAALEDAIILSLGPTHSFPLKEPVSYLDSRTVADVLSQAVLDTPFFATRWRWNASIALAVKRFSNGARTPPQFQRSNAEDLATMVFPDHLACAENLAGRRDIPDHPLVRQTMHDCLNDLMDLSGLQRILKRLEDGCLTLVCKDLPAPSPLSEEILSARNYAFLDDAPAEERRTRLVRTRSLHMPEDAGALGDLDEGVIRDIREEIWPSADNEDECHDALLVMGGVSVREARECGWTGFLDALTAASRACRISAGEIEAWVAAERLAWWQRVHPELDRNSPIAPVGATGIADRDEAIAELIKLRMQGTGPTSPPELACFFGVSDADISRSLAVLEQTGFAMRGTFDRSGRFAEGAEQWCERGLLWRIRQRSLKTMRKRVRAVSINAFMRFLFEWHGFGVEAKRLRRAPEGLMDVLAQLEGMELSAAVWEEAILPDRLEGYLPHALDMLCGSGQIVWARLNGPGHSGFRGSNRQSPVAFMPRGALGHWLEHSRPAPCDAEGLSWPARRLVELLQSGGAQFFEDLVDQGGWVASEVRSGLSELVGSGLAANDNFEGMRSLFGKASSRRRRASRWPGSPGMDGAGRWSLIRRPDIHAEAQRRDGVAGESRWDGVEHIASCLLRRYGVVFRRLLDQESSCPPWRDLLYVFRRMEARGEIRGGRFVSGFAGEQFALADAAGLLERCDSRQDGRMHSINACDPLNLTGTVIPVERVPMNRKVRLLFLDGKPVARLMAGEIEWLSDLEPGIRSKARRELAGSVRGMRGRAGIETHRFTT